MSAEPSPARGRLHASPSPGPAVLAAAAFLLGGLAATLGLTLIPASDHRVGPASISTKATGGAGRTDLFFPPLGEVQARTHRTPLNVELSLRALDVAAFGADITRPGGTTLLARVVEDDLRSMARSLAVRVISGGLLLGALALAVLPGRRRRYILAGATGGGVVTAILLGATAATFNVDAFREPRFTGALSRAPSVIDALSRGRISLPEVQSRYEGAAKRLSSLMALLGEPDADPRADSTAILHISDVHSNPIGIEIALQLVRQFDVDAVLDTGDLINFGVALETQMAEQVERIPVPYLFVPGNHDSRAVRLRLARSPNVTVLNGDVVRVGDVTILGWPDPTYTNWDALPPDQAADIRRAAGTEVAAAVRTHRPHVLAVHDHRIAEASLGDVPLVLSGHYHRRIDETYEGTRHLGVGTTGASGFRSFTFEAEMDYEAQIVYFRAGAAVAVDYVTFTGLGGDFQIQRSRLDVAPTAEVEATLAPIEETASPSPVQ